MTAHIARAVLALAILVAPGPALVAQTPEEDAALRAASSIESPAEAVTALEAFIARYPQGKTAPAAHFLLTRALLGAGAPAAKIVEQTNRALALLPAADESMLEYRLELVFGVTAELVRRGEQLDGARAIVKAGGDGLAADGSAQRLRRALKVLDATVLSAMGKREEAVASLGQVLADDPDVQMALVALGDTLEQMGRADEAIDARVRAESVFNGREVDPAPLRALYLKRHGSLDGLDARLAAAREVSLRRVALDARRVETPAPDWELKDLAGATVKLSALKGQVVVLDFWATWCPPCRQEMPHIQALHDEYAGKGVRILAVNVEGTPDLARWDKLVRDYVATTKLTVTVVNDFDYKVNQAYKVVAFPTVLVIDKTGTIRYANQGYNPAVREILKAQIESLR
jgi:thiol-disulfide isomerase/thioredoxin